MNVEIPSIRRHCSVCRPISLEKGIWFHLYCVSSEPSRHGYPAPPPQLLLHPQTFQVLPHLQIFQVLPHPQILLYLPRPGLFHFLTTPQILHVLSQSQLLHDQPGSQQPQRLPFQRTIKQLRLSAACPWLYRYYLLGTYGAKCISR